MFHQYHNSTTLVLCYYLSHVNKGILYGIARSKILGLGLLICLSIAFILKKLRLFLCHKNYKFLGTIAIISFSQASSFFGTQWIHRSESELTVNANNIPVSSLLNEWCEVCNQQCVVDHEIKSKLSLHLEKSSCDKLQTVLVDNIWAKKENDLWQFRKQPKGDWVTYACKKRAASDIAAKLKHVLSPAGKFEHIMADDVSSQIWIPKVFYEKHSALISMLDVDSPAYVVHMSWVRLNERTLQDYSISEKTKKLLKDWVSGSPISTDAIDILELLSGLEKTGCISIISDLGVVLIEDTLLESRLEEYSSTLRYDKKGKQQNMFLPQGIWVKINALHIQDKVILDILLEDRWFPDSLEANEETTLMFKTRVPIIIGQSLWLGGVTRNVDQNTRACLPIISKLPIIGRLFCKVTKVSTEKQYALIISVDQLY